MKHLLLFCAVLPFCGAGAPPPTASFDITVLKGPAAGSTTFETVRMVCRQGCAWREASFSWSTALVDASGVQQVASSSDVREGEAYVLVVRPTETGVELTCHAGCVWTQLSFEGSQADVDETGVSNIRR